MLRYTLWDTLIIIKKKYVRHMTHCWCMSTLESWKPLRLDPLDLGWVWIARLRLCFSFLFFFFLHAFVSLRLLFMYCSINSSHKLWLFYFFQSISTHRALFMDPQISLFSNFFIKNGSHGTIYTFKNYFTTVFFSFQFQFSVFNCIQTDP